MDPSFVAADAAALASFEARKAAALAGVDRSPKGSWDKPILELLNWINDQEGVFTTSSCSGRIALFEADSETSAVKGGTWLVANHSTSSADEVFSALSGAEGETSFLHEPFVLHCECADIPTAQKILRAAVGVGFKESGLSVAKRVMVAVRTTAMRLEIPMRAKSGALLVSRDYVDHVVRVANEKFEANAQRTQAFYKALKGEFAGGRAGQQRQWSLVVSKPRTKLIKVNLEALSWLDKSRRIVAAENSGMIVPLRSAGAEAIQGGERPEWLLDEEVGSLREDEVVGGAPAAQKAEVDPHTKLARALEPFVIDEELRASIPRRWEMKGDGVLLQKGSFVEWETREGVDLERLWQAVSKALGARFVCRQADVAEDDFRSSRVDLLLPPSTGDTWVTHIDNGIKYRFDVTKCMFSAGNISEKLRTAKFKCAGETIVDLYAGVGYWTIPLLKHCGAAFVYACEWNPNAAEALRKSIHLNGVEAQCQVMFGDNRDEETVKTFTGQADRVMLGLLPTSVPGYPSAVKALRPTGGMMHVHENTPDPEGCAKATAAQMSKLLEGVHGYAWQCEIVHIEKVKWYAPKIRHIVIDIRCTPSAAKSA